MKTWTTTRGSKLWIENGNLHVRTANTHESIYNLAQPFDIRLILRVLKGEGVTDSGVEYFLRIQMIDSNGFVDRQTNLGRYADAKDPASLAQAIMECRAGEPKQ